MNPTPRIILASASTARAQLVRQLAIPFDIVPADIDETPHAGEPPRAVALRLGCEKAAKIAAEYPEAVVIAGDELLINAREPARILGKPGNYAVAFEQMMAARNATLHFFTSLCVAHSGNRQHAVVETRVVMRDFSAEEAEAVLRMDKPFACAGAFRVEGVSVSLCARIEEVEPGALMGVPLLTLCRFLRAANVAIPPQSA